MVSEAPICRALLDQADERYPNRSRLSDGILSSDAHKLQNPTSDHDYGNAVDLTHSPLSGCDAHAYAKWLASKRFPWIKYIISNSRIWSLDRYNEGWRYYNGSNPHEKHIHISIYAEYRSANVRWFESGAELKMDATTKSQMQAMLDQTEAQIMAAVRAELRQVVLAITGGVRQRDAEGNVIDRDPNNISLADVFTQDEEAHKP